MSTSARMDQLWRLTCWLRNASFAVAADRRTHAKNRVHITKAISFQFGHFMAPHGERQRAREADLDQSPLFRLKALGSCGGSSLDAGHAAPPQRQEVLVGSQTQPSSPQFRHVASDYRLWLRLNEAHARLAGEPGVLPELSTRLGTFAQLFAAAFASSRLMPLTQALANE